MMEEEKRREKPNILVTGTPGVGKTTLAALVADSTGLVHLNVGKLITENRLYKEWNAEFDVPEFDEDMVIDFLEPSMAEGGFIVDFHSSGFFPERWFDLVVLVRADNTILYDRLKARGYAEKKITENIECEILEVTADEVNEAYKPEVIMEVASNIPEDVQTNVNKIYEWLVQWKLKRQDEQCI
eukprot:TRINITY_DN9740_c0_g1_i1.p1 TRINITY_DN9740_c0_g1~~TRINITY_DN9740_c0_g1_i1.p1  ORF type:complete len:184 (-),score=18.63 TRINITY_DN9740_c0_g1_i1:223-774(-)